MKKILFVEDEPDLITVVKMRLEANDFQVITAMDGEEGVRKVIEEKPDLVLLDIVMPKMDGYQVCRNLRANLATKDIPIVVITASGAKNIEEKCYEAGANYMMRKPFESSELVKKVREYLKIKE